MKPPCMQCIACQSDWNLKTFKNPCDSNPSQCHSPVVVKCLVVRHQARKLLAGDRMSWAADKAVEKVKTSGRVDRDLDAACKGQRATKHVSETVANV
jgi:hypothetical protein